MELEATQAAGLVLGVKSYGASDELDYHSPWDHIKVAAEAEHEPRCLRRFELHAAVG